MKFQFKRALLAGAAIAMTGAAGGAYAQSAGEPETLGEIVVTAQKRAERLSEVPIAITAIGSEDLARLSAAKMSDYVGYLPSVTFSSASVPGIGYLGLRGISPSDDAGATMAVYVDDTLVSNSSPNGVGGASNLDLMPFDVERVELLRGPQGTLYGANSLGGLLKYVMKKPSLDAFSAEVGAEVWSTEHSDRIGWLARGVLSGPLVEGKLGVRLSYGHREDSGWIDNVAPGHEDEDINRGHADTARLALLWKPSDDVSVDLSVLYQNSDYGSQARVAINPVTHKPVYGEYDIAYFLSTYSRQEYTIYSGTLTWDLGWATLTSATSYADSAWNQLSDLTGIFPLPGRVDFRIEQPSTKFVHETRLASAAGDRIEWMIGAYYTREKPKGDQLASTYDFITDDLVPGFNPTAVFLRGTDFTEYSAFGNVTFKFSDRFDINGGVRLAHNENEGYQAFGGFFFGNLNGVTQVEGSASDDIALWSFNARWRPVDGTMIYARAATGYRPGGFNNLVPGVDPSFGPDKTTSYEFGVKTDFAGNRAYIEAAVFRIDWDDIQVMQGALGGAVTYVVNAGEARSQGFEISGQFRPTDDLSLNASLSMNDAELTKVDSAAFGAGQAGDPLPLVSKWTGSASANWIFARFGEYEASARAGVRYIGKTENNFFNPGGAPMPATTKLDLGLELSNDRFTFGVFGRNVTDERQVYLTSPTNIVIAEPRVIGVKASARF